MLPLAIARGSTKEVIMRSMYLAAILPMLLATPAWAQSQTETIILDFKDDVSAEEIAQFEAKYGVKTKLNSIHSDAEELRLTEPLSKSQYDSLLAKMQGDPMLEHAEPLYTYTLPDTANISALEFVTEPADKFPNDPKYKHQWHLDQIRMPEAWSGNNGKGVIVSVIDTGVAYENYHDKKRNIQFKQVEDLAQTCFVKGYDFVNDSEHANDDHAHGTHVAGTIAQSTNNGVGVAGVAFKSCIMPIKVLSGQGGGTVGDIADGIRFSADHGAKVINMSLGGPFPSGIMKDAVEYARKKGVTVIAAAGNDGWRKVGYPAAYEGVIAVSATDIEDNLTFYSNYGADIDIAAPGGDTRVDKNKDGVPDGVVQNTIKVQKPGEEGYFPFMGTSMASPHAAGVAALIIGTGVTDPDKVEAILYKTAKCSTENCNTKKNGLPWGEKFGHGRIDAAAAIKIAMEEPNDYRAIFAAAFGLLSVLALRRRNRLEDNFSPVGLGAGLLAGSAGLLFFLPQMGVGLGAATPFLAQGLPSWDLVLLGANWHGSLLFFSALLPVLGLGLFGHTKAKSLVSGLSLGIAAHLLYAGLFGGFDMILPGTMLDQMWLVANAGIAGLIGYVGLMKK
jgi:serine protease